MTIKQIAIVGMVMAFLIGVSVGFYLAALYAKFIIDSSL